MSHKKRRKSRKMAPNPSPDQVPGLAKSSRPFMFENLSQSEYYSLVNQVKHYGNQTEGNKKAIQEDIKNRGLDAHIHKSWKQLPNADPKRGAKSWFFDPLALQYSLGYKDRRYNISYDLLRRVTLQLSIIGGIINTRIAQITAFAQPYRRTHNLGFVIKHKDSDHKTTRSEIEFIKELEEFILNCGRREANPFTAGKGKRDKFITFIKKIVRDSLTLDALAFEIVPDGYGLPFEFMAIDAATIRYSSDDEYVGTNSSYYNRDGFVPGAPNRFANLFNDPQGEVFTSRDGDPIQFVQLLNGQVENVYSDKELAYGIRNPRTDIYTQNYGFSEIEQMINIVTSHLYAEEYNRAFFTRGSNASGILNIKNGSWDLQELENFKREWQATVQGVENAFSLPVLQTEGLEWIELNKSNREMEFHTWMEYLIKISCSVYMIDPAELNFDMAGGVQQTPLFESSSEWKLKASKDRGLKPLLSFIAKMINEHVIDKIDDHFALEFVGLDEMSEQDKHNMHIEQLASYATLNEIRRLNDLPDVEHGDIPMNTTYVDVLRMKSEENVSMSEQETQLKEAGAEEDPNNYLAGSLDSAEEPGPDYSSGYGYSNDINATESVN